MAYTSSHSSFLYSAVVPEYVTVSVIQVIRKFKWVAVSYLKRDVPPKMHLLNIKDSPAVGLKGGRFTVVSSCTDKGTPQLNMFQTVRVKYTFQTCCGWVFDTENTDFRQTTWSTFFMALTKVIKQEKLFNYSKKLYGYNKWPCMRLRNKTKYLIKLIKCWRTLCGHLILKINYK